MTWLDELALSTVIVHTTHGESFKGLKETVYDDSLVLRDARLIEAEGMSSLINGETVIPRERVHWIQRLPEATA